MYQSRLYLFLRRIVRKTTLLPLLVHFYRTIFRLPYEASFNNFVNSNIRSTDVFWDVGANDGHYIDEMRSKISYPGKIVAFEPSPTSFQRLSDRFQNHSDIVIVNKALSDKLGKLNFFYDPNSNSSVEDLFAYHPDKKSCLVEQITSDAFVDANPSLFPNCIKIDVEGFEKQVVNGLGYMLNDVRLRCLFIEMHFSKLDSLGEKDGVQFIHKILNEKGFKLTWTDPSHLCAVRN